MFKKPLGDAKTSGKSPIILAYPPATHRLGLLAPLRSSDRRKLRTRVTERFQLTPEITDTLVPDGLLAQKFSAYNGEPGVS